MFSTKHIPAHERRQKLTTTDKSGIRRTRLIKSMNLDWLIQSQLKWLGKTYKKFLDYLKNRISNNDISIEIPFWIFEFDWFDESKMDETLTNHLNEIKNVVKINSKLIKPSNNICTESMVTYLAESLYGSWHSVLEFKSDNDEEKKWIKNYITKIAHAIKYILLNPIMEDKEWEEYWRKMLSFVIGEMRRPLVNQKGHSVVGWLYDVSYKENSFMSFRLNEYCHLIHHWGEWWSWITGMP